VLQLQKVSPSSVAAVDERLVSNVAAVVMSDFLVVIDSGENPLLASALREQLEAEYARPVRYVCVTHYHGDHTAGLSAFADVPVVGSSALARKLGDLPARAKAEMAESQKADDDKSRSAAEPMIVVPSLVFDSHVAIAAGKSLDLHYCGGHTDCSIYGYLADEKVLFAGDLVVVGEFPFMGDASADPEVWMDVLKGWMGMDVEHVVPGHGSVAGPEALRRQLDLLEVLKENTLDAIESGKDHTQIAVPDWPPLAPGHGWFVDRFRERWYVYYTARAEG
jgi:cyclase